MTPFRQTPGEKRYYELFADTEPAIVANAWTATPSATLGTPIPFVEGVGSGSRVMFGTAAAGAYVLKCTMTGSSGQIYERFIAVKVEDLY